jgi:hypothetical protein
MSKIYEQVTGSTDTLMNALLSENKRLRAALEAIITEEKFNLLRWSKDTRVKVIHAPIFDDARQSALRGEKQNGQQ